MSSNPIILITGANTGLGFEAVKSLLQSRKAYTIILSGRNIEKANDAAQVAQKAFPKSPSVIDTLQVDIEDDESISRAFDHVTKKYGRLDILVNNAGKYTTHLLNLCANISNRSTFRQPRSRRKNDNERDVEQILGRQHHRN